MLLNKRIPIGYLLNKIKVELIVVAVYAIAIQVMDEYFHFRGLAIPVSIPALLGTAISLILTFRISQSYDRWWEARKVWGAIVNDSRSLVRQVLTFAADVEGRDPVEKMQKQIAYRQAAWCYALGESLRDFDPHENKQGLLSDADQKEMLQHSNVPNGLLLMHSRDISLLHEQGSINDYQQVEMDSTITRLCDWMGMSERINNTVFPKQYSLLVEFFLYLFVLILPFGLIDHFAMLEAPLTILISVPFFMLEKTALHLQDPFMNKPTDISVTAIASTIEENIRQMLDEKFTKEPEPDSFYLL